MTMQSAGTAQAQTPAPAPSVEATIEAYKARRSELNSQLVSLTVRRDLLTQQVRNASGADAQQLNAQLANVSQRNLQVLKSLGEIDDAVNKLLAGAPVVAQVPAPPPMLGDAGTTVTTPLPPVDRSIQLERVAAVSVVAAAMLLVGLWRFLRRPVAALSAADVGRLEKLQQSVDVIALEVERLGESHRYLSKVLSDGHAIGAGPAQNVGDARRESVPETRRS